MADSVFSQILFTGDSNVTFWGPEPNRLMKLPDQPRSNFGWVEHFGIFSRSRDAPNVWRVGTESDHREYIMSCTIESDVNIKFTSGKVNVYYNFKLNNKVATLHCVTASVDNKYLSLRYYAAGKLHKVYEYVAGQRYYYNADGELTLVSNSRDAIDRARIAGKLYTLTNFTRCGNIIRDGTTYIWNHDKYEYVAAAD